VIGTHGRGFWVLDNIAPLRQATPAILASDAHLFTPPTLVRSGSGVVLSWWLKAPYKTAKLEILDSTGALCAPSSPIPPSPTPRALQLAAVAVVRPTSPRGPGSSASCGMGAPRGSRRSRG
jgi:hypothetical protein